MLIVCAGVGAMLCAGYWILKWRKSAAASLSAAAPVAESAMNARVQTRPPADMVRLDGIRGGILEVRRAQGPSRTEVVPAGVALRVSKLLSSTPWTLLAADLSGETRYAVEFTDSIQQMLDAGLLDLAQVEDGRWRAFAVDGGKIVEHGTLVESGQMLPLAASAWSVASILAAQHHLVEIRGRLKRIEGGVNRLLDQDLVDQEAVVEEIRSSILDRLRAVLDGGADLNRGEERVLCTEWDRELRTVVRKVLRRMRLHSAELPKLEVSTLSVLTGAGKVNVAEWILRREQWSRILQLACPVLVAVQHLWVAVGGDPKVGAQRQRSLVKLLNDVAGQEANDGREWRDFGQSLVSRMPIVGARKSELWSVADRQMTAGLVAERKGREEVEVWIARIQREGDAAGDRPRLCLEVLVRDGVVMECRKVVPE